MCNIELAVPEVTALPIARLAPPPPIHVPRTEKHPAARSTPPVPEKVLVPIRKFATPFIEKREDGVVEPMPVKPDDESTVKLPGPVIPPAKVEVAVVEVAEINGVVR